MSNDRLNETLSDIQNMLTRFTWEVMDEDQRDEVMTKIVVPRWGKTTRDGKELRGTLWAEILGTTVATVKGRYQRISDSISEQNRRSEGTSDGPPSLSAQDKSQVRAARSVVRNPVRAAALVSDPEVRAALKEVMGDGPDLEAQRAAAEKARREEQEKAAAKKREDDAKHAADLERAKQEKLEALARLEKQLKETASTQEFDLNSLTQAQKAEIMTLLANDPDSATDWFDAQREERKRKLAEQELKAKEAAEKRREQMEDRERRTAQVKASEDFKHSALKAFTDLEAAANKVKEILEEKGGVTFSHITASGRSANDWVSATELVEDVAVAIRESIFEANAFLQLQDVEAD